MLHVRIIYYRHLTPKTSGHVYRAWYSLGDKRSLSLGELIHPFCITIFYYNLLLIIDIFHIRIQFLCCFILFCMFTIKRGKTPEARKQEEKYPRRYPISSAQKNPRKITKF